MSWEQIAENWPQFQSKIKQQWGKLTNDDLARIQGNRDALIARLQDRYGWSREQCEQEITDFCHADRWSFSSSP